jgi:hypothetical protein
MFEVRYLEPEIATAQIPLGKRRGGKQNKTSTSHDAIIPIIAIPTKKKFLRTT